MSASALPSARPPRILVTGATGFIGRALVQRVLDSGTEVRVFARRPPPEPLQGHPLVSVEVGDLADAAAVDRAVAGVAVVYHLGAATSGSPEDFDSATRLGTLNVVESCLRHGVGRLVHMSSLAVVDADEGRDGAPIDERSAIERSPAARGTYSRVKIEAELVVRQAVVARGLRAVVLRPGEVVSAERTLMTPGVALRVGPFVVVIGDGGMRLPLVHVADVVDAILAATEVAVAPGATFQLVDACGITQNDILAHHQRTGPSGRVVRVPTGMVLAFAAVVETVCGWIRRPAPLSPRRIVAATTRRTYDCAKARRELHWTPRVGVRAAFAPPITSEAGTGS